LRFNHATVLAKTVSGYFRLEYVACDRTLPV
jgi:hypothetical protein